MNQYEAKQEARRQRLLAAAAKADTAAAQAFDKADLREEVSGIPLGQPRRAAVQAERRALAAIPGVG